jgi:hypothetical protein
MYPNNSQCCFKVKLPKTIHIEKESWEVALAQLITPSQFLNISKHEAEFHLVTANVDLLKAIEKANRKRDNMSINPIRRNETSGKPDKWDIRFQFEPGSYNSPAHVLGVMNEVLQNSIGEELASKNITLHIGYAEALKRPKFGFTNIGQTGVTFHPFLFLKLGGNPEFQGEIIHPGKNIIQMFKYSPNLDAGYNHLYIYSDIAEYNVVGDTLAPILRVTPFKTSNAYENVNGSQHINHELSNLQYIPVSKSEFDTIHIQITGDAGIPVQFVIGKTIVKLHFRQNREK